MDKSTWDLICSEEEKNVLGTSMLRVLVWESRISRIHINYGSMCVNLVMH